MPIQKARESNPAFMQAYPPRRVRILAMSRQHVCPAFISGPSCACSSVRCRSAQQRRPRRGILRARDLASLQASAREHSRGEYGVNMLERRHTFVHQRRTTQRHKAQHKARKHAPTSPNTSSGIAAVARARSGRRPMFSCIAFLPYPTLSFCTALCRAQLKLSRQNKTPF